MKNNKSQYLAIKRITDIALSSIFLLIAMPFFIIIPFLIKIDSQGKVFIIQKRIGFKGKEFYIYKFRTMKKYVDLYKISPTNNFDSRVTKFGRFLRRFSLDEIPQLYNVLKGEMSLVGPRPEMPFIVLKYSDNEKKRLSVKPGLTGLWQIKARKDIPLYKNLDYDFEYINNQSVLFDLKIILKTIPALIKGKGSR